MRARKIVEALRKPPSQRTTLGRLVGMIGLGLALLVGGLYGFIVYPLVERTNSLEFCISCHEMRTTVYEEYRQTPHFRNKSGTRASCPDCHVPKEFLPRLVAKVRASKDVWHSMMGTIDTREKFEAKRWEMANRVWEMMERTDSATCRSCHEFSYMNYEEQDRSARRKHKAAEEEGKTCIECHKGLVHEYPKEPEEAKQADAEQEPGEHG